MLRCLVICFQNPILIRKCQKRCLSRDTLVPAPVIYQTKCHFFCFSDASLWSRLFPVWSRYFTHRYSNKIFRNQMDLNIKPHQCSLERLSAVPSRLSQNLFSDSSPFGGDIKSWWGYKSSLNSLYNSGYNKVLLIIWTQMAQNMLLGPRPQDQEIF